jgi:preprotein translocase subunit SecG
MIGLVLLQRSEGGALGIGGGSGAFMSGRGAGNVLTRSTGILAAVFFATSIGLALLARMEMRPSDILDRIPGQAAPAGNVPAPPPLPTGAPASAQDVLQGLGGGSGPQTPPADAGAAAPAPAVPTPAPTPAPAPAPAVDAGAVPSAPTPPPVPAPQSPPQ